MDAARDDDALPGRANDRQGGSKLLEGRSTEAAYAADLHMRSDPVDNSPPVAGARGAPRRKAHGGVFLVLNAVHAKHCTLGKNAKAVAVAIGWRMGRRHAFVVGIPQLMQDTKLGRQAVVRAVGEACGPRGFFEKKRRGPGNCNLYTLKASLMCEKRAISEGRELTPQETSRSGDN